MPRGRDFGFLACAGRPSLEGPWRIPRHYNYLWGRFRQPVVFQEKHKNGALLRDEGCSDGPVGVAFVSVGATFLPVGASTVPSAYQSRPSASRPRQRWARRAKRASRRARRKADRTVRVPFIAQVAATHGFKTRAREAYPPIMPEFVVFLLSPPIEGMVVTQGALEGYRQENAALHAFRFVIASPPGRGNPFGMVGAPCRPSAGLPRRDLVPPRNDKEENGP